MHGLTFAEKRDLREFNNFFEQKYVRILIPYTYTYMCLSGCVGVWIYFFSTANKNI